MEVKGKFNRPVDLTVYRVSRNKIILRGDDIDGSVVPWRRYVTVNEAAAIIGVLQGMTPYATTDEISFDRSESHGNVLYVASDTDSKDDYLFELGMNEALALQLALEKVVAEAVSQRGDGAYNG